MPRSAHCDALEKQAGKRAILAFFAMRVMRWAQHHEFLAPRL
jgi:hypothetical protein